MRAENLTSNDLLEMIDVINECNDSLSDFLVFYENNTSTFKHLGFDYLEFYDSVCKQSYKTSDKYIIKNKDGLYVSIKDDETRDCILFKYKSKIIKYFKIIVENDLYENYLELEF